MSQLHIRSTNPDFSYLLQKNPETGILLRPLKRGMLIGGYMVSNNKIHSNKYLIAFKDADNEVSIKSHPDEQFEYLNISRFNSGHFVIYAIREFLNHLEKNNYSEANRDIKDKYEHTININMVRVGMVRYLEMFQENFEEFDLKYGLCSSESWECRRDYWVEITTKKSLSDLINYTNLLALFLVLLNDDEHIWIEENVLGKYIGILNNIDAPYFIRYLFKNRAISDKLTLFKQYKEELEKSDKYKIEFEIGNNLMQRKNFISEILDFKRSIVDVGCGEGNYTIPFSKKLDDDKFVHAIDIDEEKREIINLKANRKKIENIMIYSSLDDYNDVQLDREDEPVDIICTEVIEHLTLPKAKTFINKLLKTKNANKIIITTPNNDFNKYYGMEDVMRHDDHKFEIGDEEFKLLMAKQLNKKNVLNYEFAQIGDLVNNVASTQAVVIEML